MADSLDLLDQPFFEETDMTEMQGLDVYSSKDYDSITGVVPQAQFGPPSDEPRPPPTTDSWHPPVKAVSLAEVLAAFPEFTVGPGKDGEYPFCDPSDLAEALGWV